MEKIIKIAGIEFIPSELEKYYNNEAKYILKYRSIYELYKDGEKFKARKIYTEQGKLPITRRGRFFVWTKLQVESLLESFGKIEK